MFDKLFYSAVNDWGENVFYPTKLGYVCLIVFFAVLIVMALILSGRAMKKGGMTRQLVFSAMAMALATVLSELRLWKMPMGGSVTPCSMLCVCLIGFWFGPAAGLMTGMAHGFLQLILNPMIYSIPQMLIDYPLAFGALGLSGCFWNVKNGLLKGYILGIVGRFVFAVMSGFLFFADYAPENMNPFVYSVLYNGGYIFAEAALTIVIILLPPVKKALASVKQLALGNR